MNHSVAPNVYSSVRIPLWIRNELAIQVLVVSSKNDITRLNEFNYTLNVVPRHIEWIWVIYNYG